MDLNLRPDEKTDNVGRLTILLFRGGTEALKCILFRLLLQKNLDRKKDYIKKQVGISLTQPQFDKLFPATGQPPNLEEIDTITMVILQQMLSVPNSSEDTKQSIIKHVLNDGLKKHLIHTKGHFLKVQNYLKKQIYPLSSSVNVDAFDITLLACIISTSFGITPSTGNWTEQPSAGDTNLGDDVCRIRIYRNYICHIKHYGIDEKEFNEKWQDIANVLTRILGCSYQSDIEELKVAPLSPKHVIEYQAVMDEWIKQEKEIMDCMEELTATMKEDHKRLEKGITAVLDNVLEMKDMIHRDSQGPSQQPNTDVLEMKDMIHRDSQGPSQQPNTDPTTKTQREKCIIQKNYNDLRENLDIDTGLPKVMSKCAISFEDNDRVKVDVENDTVPDNSVSQQTSIQELEQDSFVDNIPQGTVPDISLSQEASIQEQELHSYDGNIPQDSASSNIPPQGYQRQLTNRNLQAFANAVSVKDAVLLGMNLGLTTNELDAIRIDNYPFGVNTQMVCILEKWLSKQETEGTVGALEERLREAEKLGIQIDWVVVQEAVERVISAQ